MVASWTAPADWSGESIHPGMGRMLIKAGERSGLPIAVSLTPAELKLYETTHVAGPTKQASRMQITDGRQLPPLPPGGY